MRMTKRSFLGLMGGAAVSGPKALPKVAESVLPGVLKTGGLALLDADANDRPTKFSHQGYGTKDWALKELAKWAVKTTEDWNRERTEFEVHRFTPDVHALKSVSLGHKMKMMQDISFERWKEKQYEHLVRTSLGLEDD